MNAPISALLDHKGSLVHAIEATLSAFDAVAEMNRLHIGAIVILDGEKLAGIFTERDVLRRIVGDGVDPRTTCVMDVATKNMLTVSPTATVAEVASLFTEKHCRHLPVVSEGRLVGLISIGDISRWVADANRAEAEHLKNSITGGFPP